MNPTLDPRAKLAVLVLINIFIITSPDMLTEAAGVGLTALVVLIMGAARTCVKAVVIYACVVGVFYLCGLFHDNVLSAVIPMFAVCFRKVAPALFLAGGIIATTKVGELVAAMQKLRIPKPIVITFAVTLRFFPSAKEEFAAIRDAAKLRGLRFSVERTLIPMMMRCATIAEELSAAAVTRGIENCGKRTSINELKMHGTDYAVIVLFLAFTVFSAIGGLPLLLR